MRMTKTALLALTLTSSFAVTATNAEAQITPAPEQLYVEYTGSVLFLKVADISLSAAFTDETYSAAATFQSAGLLSWFDDTDIEASTSGYRVEAGLTPYRYEHTNHASNKGRVVGIDFEDGTAMPDVQPPFGSMGDPAATDEERAGALDPVSALLQIVTAIPSGETGRCEGRVPVFDGKARYNLRLNNAGMDTVRTRGWRGEALRCQAFIEPISGYDEGDRPSEDDTNRPVTIWLADIEDVLVPVRFRAQTELGSINVVASRVYAGAASQ